MNVIFFDGGKGIPSCVLFRGMVRNGIPRMCIYSILVLRNGILRCILFRRRVRNRIMGFCFYFCTTEQNSELFSLPRKGSERNPRFSVPQNSRNSVGNNHLFRLFRLPRNYFFVGNSQPYRRLTESRSKQTLRFGFPSQKDN